MNIPENNKYTNDQTILNILSKHPPCYKLTKTVLSIIAQPNQSLPLPISLIIVQSHDKHFVLDLDTNPNFLRYRGNSYWYQSIKLSPFVGFFFNLKYRRFILSIYLFETMQNLVPRNVVLVGGSRTDYEEWSTESAEICLSGYKTVYV